MTRTAPVPEPGTDEATITSPESHALLSRAVDEAARLLQADGAMVYLVDTATGNLEFAVDAGIRNAEAKQLIRDLSLPVGSGMFGHAVKTGELIVSGDYRNDRRFTHAPTADRIVAVANMRSMAVAPLQAEGEVLGALGAYSSRIDDFDEAEVALLRALADHAATAIANQRLIERLARSQEELARRVEAQQILAEITSSIAGIRGTDEVLQQVVDAARRLIGSDGAHLTLMSENGAYLRPTVVAGGNDAWTEEWLAQLEFPVDGGINGLAAGRNEVVATEDYLTDPRIPHEADDQAVAERLRLRGVAAAPLRGPAGQVIGTLAVSFPEPHRFGDDELQLLAGLADQGAIAISNARLVDRLSSSESRFRHLVTSSPDLVWETDAEGRFTFLSPRLEDLTGWNPHELLGQPWGSIVEQESMEQARETWQQLQADPTQVRKIRFLLRQREGEPIPAEVYAIGSDRDGTFTGAHGSIRDLTESEQLLARLRTQARELERRVDAQRTLAEMAAQLTSLRDPSTVLEQTLQAAVRLLQGHGGQIGMVARDDAGVLRWGDGHSLVHGRLVPFTKDDHTPVDDGISGRAVTEGRATWTADYLADQSFPHDENSDAIAERLGIRAVIAAPLVDDSGPMGAIGVYAERPGVFDADAAELLGLLADQAAIVLINARLYAEAAVSAERLAHRVEAQRTLGEIAAAITSLRDPSAVLARTIDEAKRLLSAEHVVIHQVRAGSDELADYREVFGAGPDVTPVDEVTVHIGQGVAGRAVAQGIVSWTGDYLADSSFAHTDRADEWITRTGYQSQISAPLVGESGALGAITAYSTRRDAFGDDDAQLLGALASQAAIVLGNARLYEELERRVEAQRTLGEIATRITAIRDPGDVLQRTLDEAVRLLDADGGRIELVSEGGGLHWAFGHSAIDLPIERDVDAPPEVGTEHGVSGRAVAERRVIRTGDYLTDAGFPHSDAADRYIRQHGIRSVISAPIIGEDGAIGSITVHSQARDAFDDANEELLEVLATQAAIAVTNARLYEQLRERVEAQRALASISAEIASLHDPAAVLQRTAEEAMRLLAADTAIINPLENDDTLLGWPIAYAPSDGPADDIPVRLGEGISGQAMSERRVLWTGDYLNDPAFTHSAELDAYITRRKIRSVMTAPLVSSAGGLGALTVQAERANAFGEDDAELLRLLADQAAIAITNARLYDELGEESAALARQTDSQRRLLQINERLLSTLDPEGVLDLIADGLKSVVWFDYLGVYRVDHEDGLLHPVLARDRNAAAVLGYPIPRGKGVTWWSVEHREPVLLNDALGDPRVITIPGTPDEEEAIIIVPLVSGEDVIGAMNIARRGGAEVAFTDADFELVQLFAGQAAIAVTNARLVEQLRERADAQKSLAEIAAQIAALHDPTTVIQRAVADAARLLRADRAQINLAMEDGAHLDRPIAAAPTPPSPDDVMVPIGSGIAGTAAAEKRVRWTGDYLDDQAFPHDEGDRRIEAQDIHSMMSAPLLGPDRLIGTITVQSTARGAFGADDAELLKLLADQAAIAITNARLYAEVEESERRYRHLVDNSPDIVWEVDAEGRFTFFSEQLEAKTGMKPEDLLGKPFAAVLGSPETADATAEVWESLRTDPDRGYRINVELPLPDGRLAKTEVTITGTVVDGRFAGAHGSVRDISERERLEGDLRSQAAELAASQERAHLARELHDSVTQALFSMGLTLRTLELLLESDPDQARTKLVELRELQKDALAEMRTLIFELRPSSLENDGLVQALRTHATAVQRRTGLTIVVDAEPIERLPLAAEEALYRIGQEALHNVVKHANAANATIRIVQDGRHVRLSVNDDGAGFDPDAVPRGHLGLIGMRQRIELVGGELRVESRPGHGTLVEAAVPVVGAPEAEQEPASAE
ncbi:MAG TPA: GAF domain-containing protein [Candidatus Angelobacter sp.]|nr:GAF domain-containing protein [Candidatus Angelobacter sp.]